MPFTRVAAAAFLRRKTSMTFVAGSVCAASLASTDVFITSHTVTCYVVEESRGNVALLTNVDAWFSTFVVEFILYNCDSIIGWLCLVCCDLRTRAAALERGLAICTVAVLGQPIIFTDTVERTRDRVGFPTLSRVAVAFSYNTLYPNVLYRITLQACIWSTTFMTARGASSASDSIVFQIITWFALWAFSSN